MAEDIKRKRSRSKSGTYDPKVLYEGSFPIRQPNILKYVVIENENGRWFMDFRIFYESEDEIMLPTRKGFRISIDFINDLDLAVQKIKTFLEKTTSVE